MNERTRQRAIIVSATCECQAGRYIAEMLEHSGTDKSGTHIPGYRLLTIDQARRRDLVPPHPTTHAVYLLHAMLAEARHDMVRRGDEDDSRIRYLEAAAAQHEVPV